jgi:hypothetical protein
MQTTAIANATTTGPDLFLFLGIDKYSRRKSEMFPVALRWMLSPNGLGRPVSDPIRLAGAKYENHRYLANAIDTPHESHEL